MKIKRITFSEICRLLADRDGDAKNCAAEIFRFALALPDLLGPELAKIIESFSAFPIKEALNAKDAILKVFKKNDNYYSSYENAQIAHVLTIFSAYFDTVSRLLPDEKWQINLESGEIVTLSEDALTQYLTSANHKLKQPSRAQFRELLDYDLSMPGSFDTKESFDKRLLRFYQLLNDQFFHFYFLTCSKLTSAQLDFVNATLRSMPENALETYYQQQAALSKEFPEYYIYRTVDWQRKTTEAIDVGFRMVSEQISNSVVQDRESRTNETIALYDELHREILHQSILKSQNHTNVDSDGVTFPTKQDIFIPQGFKALPYRPGTPLEPDATWEELPQEQDIGGFISHTLRHWDTGDKPMVILGLPGAGKTLLCDMLAAQILRQEYHVIIIRLRDTNAELPIADQITGQLHRDLGTDCKWFDIVKSKPQKPITLIFDGYDELLQASGRTYADYITKVHEFQQKQQTLFDVTIRCIITSRTTLIDKSDIPYGSPIIRLLDFDKERIDRWREIWNSHNRGYFQKHNLEEFTVDPESKVYDLAKQPLLLMLLARFDAHGNALLRHRNLTRAQLYSSLIRDFILREQEKDQKFRSKPDFQRREILDRVFCRFGIVAMGMYNRSSTFINSDQLNQDLSYFTGEENMEQDGDQLFGSFFFIHTSKAKAQQKNLYAYEFLHNTFGEFLAADYMARQLHPDEPCPDRQYVCLSYAPLFSRPVVPEMFRELMEDSKDATIRALDELLRCSLHGILSGEILTKLITVSADRAGHLDKQEPIRHLAIYTANLLILRAALGDYTIALRDYHAETDIWDRLLSIWKYAFTQEDLTRLAGLIRTAKEPEHYTVTYTSRGSSFLKEENLSRLYYTATHLQDTLTIALAGALDGVGNCVTIGTGYDLETLKGHPPETLGDLIRQVVISGEYTRIKTEPHRNNYYYLETTDIIPAAEAHGLAIVSKFLWNRAIDHFSDDRFREISRPLMEDLFAACIQEKNYAYLYACYCVMLRLIENSGIRTLSPKDSRRLSEMLLDRLSIFPSPCDDSVSKEVYLKLIGYLDLEDPQTIDTMGKFLYRTLTEIKQRVGYSPVSDLTARYILQMLRVCSRLMECPKVDLTSILSPMLFICKKILEDGSEIEDRYALHRQILLFAGRLLSTKDYAHSGSSLQSTYEWYYLAPHTTYAEEPDPDFTATVICYLHILAENGQMPALELLNPILKGVSIGDLYRVYPDSLPMLINLMGYNPNQMKILFEKMAQFVTEQGGSLPVHICKTLRTLASKTSLGAPLLAALNALLA